MSTRTRAFTLDFSRIRVAKIGLVALNPSVPSAMIAFSSELCARIGAEHGAARYCDELLVAHAANRRDWHCVSFGLPRLSNADSRRPILYAGLVGDSICGDRRHLYSRIAAGLLGRLSDSLRRLLLLHRLA